MTNKGSLAESATIGLIIIIIILNHFFPMTLGGYFEKRPFCGGKFLT
jgi:hypothetical protein